MSLPLADCEDLQTALHGCLAAQTCHVDGQRRELLQL